MTVSLAAKLAETATNGAMSMAKKPFECVKCVSLYSANAVAEVGGYHEMSIGPVKFRSGDGGKVPDKKYVDVIGNQNTTVVDRNAAALIQQSHNGHVTTEPLSEAMTVFSVTYPVLSEQLTGGKTEYVVTSLNMPNTLRMKCQDDSHRCPCPLDLSSCFTMPKIGEDDDDSAEENVLYGGSPAWHVGQACPQGPEPQVHGVTPVPWPHSDDEDAAYTPGTIPRLPRRAQSQEFFDAEENLPLIRTELCSSITGGPPPVGNKIMEQSEFDELSKLLATTLRFGDGLPRDDLGAIHNEVLAKELNITAETLDQVVWASQGSHELRFESIQYGELVTIRLKHKGGSPAGPPLMNREYNREAARNVTHVDSSGTRKNTIGIFNDLFPGQKYAYSHTKSGPDHDPAFVSEIQFGGVTGKASAASLQLSKSFAMGELLAEMLMPSELNRAHALEMTNRHKKVFRAYLCIGHYKPDEALLSLVIEQLTREGTGSTTKELARILGVTTRCINQLCHHHPDKFTKATLSGLRSGWELHTGARPVVSEKLFGTSATATMVSTLIELREVVKFHIQVPARYVQLALSMTAGNSGVSNISYIATRFRSMLSDDEAIPSKDVDVYVGALTLLAFVTRNSSTIPCANVVVDHKGTSCLNICIDNSLTVDEKFAMLAEEKRPKGDMHVLASYDATNFAGIPESVRTVVYPNPGSTRDVDKPTATYKCAQVAPNVFGLAGPLDVSSTATIFSALMRNMADGKKQLCEGVTTDIVKKPLKGRASRNYQIALDIVAKGDVKCFSRLVKAGEMGADCQTPPTRFSEQEAADLYSVYSDWYDRVGPDKADHRAYVQLGLLEKARPEIMKTFLKGGEVDDRGRFIQPTSQNDGHTVCNGNVVKVIARTVKLSRPANLFKGLTENGKKHYFGKFRETAFKTGASIHCFDRSKQDWLTSLKLLEAYEDYMNAISEAMVAAGFDKVANTMFSSKNKATKCTLDEFVLMTEHAWVMLTSACAQTSDANRFKTEVELLTFLLDIGWSAEDCQAVYDSWNNPAHRSLEHDCDGNLVAVPNSKMILPAKYEGDDTTTMDKHCIFERDHVPHCVKFAAFNGRYSTSWIPSDSAVDHGPLSPIDTLSVFFFSDHDRERQNNSTRLASGRPDFAIPHPVKKAKSLVTMWSPANLKFSEDAGGTVRLILDDQTRIAIVTAKTAQAETMCDLLWLRRVATQSAQYFLQDHDDTEYIASAQAIWDPRDPEARGHAPTYETPVVQRLVEVDGRMPDPDASKELLIANAEAWRMSCPLLRSVAVDVLAAELVALDVQVDTQGIHQEDFDVRHSFQSIQAVAPNIARVCEKHLAKTVTRLEGLGGEGTVERLEQQKEAVRQLLSVGGKRREYQENAVTNERNHQRQGASTWNKNPSGDQRRGASETWSSGYESRGDRNRGGDDPDQARSSNWTRW